MIHLTLPERKVVLFLSFLFAVGAFLTFFKKTTGCNECVVGIYSEKNKPVIFDVNQVSREGLISLPGIGEKTADAILAYRASKVRIKDLAELKKIKGMTETKLDILESYLTAD